MASYNYVKVVNSATLSDEIESSAIITIALDYINASDTDCDIFFKASLSASEITELDTIVTAHDSSTLADASNDLVTLDIVHENGVPIFHSTAKPKDWYTYFTGNGDSGLGQDGMAAGDKIIFDMLSTDVSKTVVVSFNEDVYIKDGNMITNNAPFGACMDVEIKHPLVGHILWFAKKIPMCWNNHFQLNTQDKSFMPMGLELHITLRNAMTNPADFQVQGRLEMYRANP